jgi:hypothetical protein
VKKRQQKKIEGDVRGAVNYLVNMDRGGVLLPMISMIKLADQSKKY